jgi:hypothetical protein
MFLGPTGKTWITMKTFLLWSSLALACAVAETVQGTAVWLIWSSLVIAWLAGWANSSHFGSSRSKYTEKVSWLAVTTICLTVVLIWVAPTWLDSALCVAMQIMGGLSGVWWPTVASTKRGYDTE